MFNLRKTKINSKISRRKEKKLIQFKFFCLFPIWFGAFNFLSISSLRLRGTRIFLLLKAKYDVIAETND